MPLELVRVPAGESGLTQNVNEDKAEELAELIASGELDERILAHEVGLSVMTVRKAIRSARIQALVKSEVQARACLLMAKAIESAHQDMISADGKARGAARDFIKKVSESESGQVGSGQWDPADDEALFDRAKTLLLKEVNGP